MRVHALSLALAVAQLGCAAAPRPVPEGKLARLNDYHQVEVNAARRQVEEAEIVLDEANVSRAEAAKFLSQTGTAEARRLLALRTFELDAARQRLALSRAQLAHTEAQALRSEGRSVAAVSAGDAATRR
jgi:hypothetical protein